MQVSREKDMADGLMQQISRTEKDEELANEIMRNRMKYIRA